MTTAHPRDPRLRRLGARPPVDPLSAAVALEQAADRMRLGLRGPEPEPAGDALDPEVLAAVQEWDTAAHLTHTIADDTPAALSGFAQASTPAYWDEHRTAIAEQLADAATEPPAPVTPAPVFSSEHPPRSWRSRHDPRSRAFGVSRVLRGTGPLQDVRLPAGPVLDQTTAGTTLEEQSCCTGCGIVAAHNVLRPYSLDLGDAEAIYELGRRRDAVPGEDYPGTSVLAALQAAQELGIIGGYLWCFGTRDIAQTIIQTRRPVVIGIPWLSGMWDTGPAGLVTLTGDDEGLGHVVTIVGVQRKGPQGQPGPYFVWQNSAGESYGDAGFGYVHHRDLAELLRGVGEAAVPTLEPQEPAP
jgi:hypothetical protein